MADDNETHSTRGPTCPHCGHIQDTDEAIFFDEDSHDDECGDCGKLYTWTHHRSDSWRAVPREGT